MRVPPLDLKPQLNSLREEILEAVTQVIDSTQYVMGPVVAKFEKSVAEYLGIKHAIGVSSGTDALLVALMGLNIGPDDIVITTPYSFFATAGVIARLNAKIMMADINLDTYNLDPGKTEELLKSLNEADLKRVKAILPVHLYGQSADMSGLMELSEKYGIPIIEDGAQAIGARIPIGDNVLKAGTIGLAGCFSFFPSKNLGAAGDGGMVVTNDDEFANYLRLLRNHGAKPKYYHSYIGGNFRLDPLQAAILQVKLPHLECWHEGRQKNATYYDEQLADMAEVKTPIIAYEREYHIYNQYVILVPRRDELMAFLGEREIGTNIYYPVPFHLQPCFKDLGLKEGDFPASEATANGSLALPIYPELSKEQLDHVISSIREFYNA
jgi:dTDP-4-amino-4,6-dideoxygalactose transaminase